jgi:uncharacterized protein
MRSLEPAIKTVWTIKFAIVSACLFTVVLGYEIYAYIAGSGDLPIPAGAISAAVFLIGLLFTVATPRLQYRYWQFDLRPEELYIERGIFNRIRTVVPLRRIQHLDVSQNILEREFELSKLIVHTAGSRSSDVVLPGLRMEEAERLRDDVKRYILDDAV